MTLYEDKFPYVPHSAEDAQFIGEAILEQSFNLKDPKLYEIVGLDRDNWKIVGIQTTLANAYHAQGDVTILAADRSKLGDEQNHPGGLVGARALEVVKFETSLTFEDIMSAMKSSSIFYKSKGLKDAEFYVVDERELPARD